jgi:hypothetical protein
MTSLDEHRRFLAELDAADPANDPLVRHRARVAAQKVEEEKAAERRRLDTPRVRDWSQWEDWLRAHLEIERRCLVETVGEGIGELLGEARREAAGELDLGRVLINAQIGSPLSETNRKTFAHFETYRF